jgi:hypothetical protein
MKERNKTKVTGIHTITAGEVPIDHWTLFFRLNKALDYISLSLILLRDRLGRHFPKLIVFFLFLPFAAIIFLFGWLLLTLVPNNS